VAITLQALSTYPQVPFILTIDVSVKKSKAIPPSKPGAPKANGNSIAATQETLPDEVAAVG
jgi:hypothetical protein